MFFLKKVKLLIKNHHCLYHTYLYFSQFIIGMMKFILKPKKGQILFISFNGDRFDDSPKAIYDYMINDEFFNDYEFIWAFQNPSQFHILRGKKISFDSFKYFYYAMTSQVWITNVAVERGLAFKHKDTIYINTWHGTPLKNIDNEKAKNKNHFSQIDIMCAQSCFDQNIFSDIFHIKKENILCCDLPRNDILCQDNQDKIKKIKKDLNIPINKKVILYMPTYREYQVDKNGMIIFDMPIDFKKWYHYLKDDYIILFRAHYLVDKVVDYEHIDFIKSVSTYPVLNELFLISDLLISDYSSAYFDYSILNKPMFCFAYDYQEYLYKRGLYMYLNILPCQIHYNEDSLLDDLLHFSYTEACKKTKEFQEKFAPHCGNASQCVVETLKNKLNGGINQ